MRKGDILLANLGQGEGNEQSGIRPVIVVQNEIANNNSNTITIVPLTDTEHKKTKLPTHLNIKPTSKNRLIKNSTALCESIATISKTRILKDTYGRLNEDTIKKINKRIKIHLDMLEED
jgi:mRNA interferase MazF